tara:strand:- start:4 stop:654 length:651 start_codon:yes stop_codon:yes gene_type:complete
MPCRNCQSKNLTFNKALQLPVCVECEMIQANRIWEVRERFELPNHPLGNSESREDSLLHLLASEYDLNKHINSIRLNYETLKRDLFFKGYDLETQIVSVIYYTLQINNVPVYIRKYCKFVGANVKLVFRLTKKIEKYFQTQGVFILDNLDNYYSQAGINDVEEITNSINNFNGTLTRSVIAWFVYKGSSLTQIKTCELFGISLPRLKRAKRLIENG